MYQRICSSTGIPAHHLVYHRLPLNCFPMFSVSTCLAHLFLVTLHPQTAQSTSISFHTSFHHYSLLYFPRDISAITPSLSGIIPCPLFPMRKASITRSIPSPEHFQSHMPSAFPTLLVLSFYHNVSTRNPVLCSFQMFSPNYFSEYCAHTPCNKC